MPTLRGGGVALVVAGLVAASLYSDGQLWSLWVTVGTTSADVQQVVIEITYN